MSWFRSIWKFFGRLTRRRDNRVRPTPDGPLMPSAEREELQRWGKEMREKSRNRMSLKEMKKLKVKKEKMMKLTKSKIEERGQTHDDDKESESVDTELSRGKETPEASISDMTSSDLQNESENHDQSEKSDIEEDPNEKEEIGPSNDDDDTDSDVSSKLDNSESSHEDVGSTSDSDGPPEHPILDRDEFSETSDEAEEEEEEMRGSQVCDDESSIKSEDRDSDSDAQNNNLWEVRGDQDSDLVIDLQAQGSCKKSESEEKVRGRRRVSKESFSRKKLGDPTSGKSEGVVLLAYNAKAVGQHNYDITPTRSYEQVGKPDSIGKYEIGLPGEKIREEKTSENLAKQAVFWNSAVSSDSNGEDMIVPEKVDPIRDQKYSEIIGPVETSLSSKVTSSDEELELKDDQSSEEEKTAEMSSEVERTTGAAKKSSSVKLLLREGFRRIISKISWKKKSNGGVGIGVAEPATVKPKSKKNTRPDPGRRLMRSSKDDIADLDKKRMEMLACLKEAKILAQKKESLYDGVVHQAGGGRRAPLE